MTRSSSRRETLKGGLALAGAAVFGLPEWALPAPQQGEVVVPFADMPENFPTDRGETRLVDVRKIDGPFTPSDRFYAVQHYGQPEVDAARFRLKLSGLVDKPLALSLAELRAMGSAELVAGFECSGNRPPLQALCSNGRWTGLPLRSVLEKAGVKAEAREFVFLGADRKKEQVEFRAQK